MKKVKLSLFEESLFYLSVLAEFPPFAVSAFFLLKGWKIALYENAIFLTIYAFLFAALNAIALILYFKYSVFYEFHFCVFALKFGAALVFAINSMFDVFGRFVHSPRGEALLAFQIIWLFCFSFDLAFSGLLIRRLLVRFRPPSNGRSSLLVSAE